MDTKLDIAKNVATWTAKTLGQSVAVTTAQYAGMFTGAAAVAVVASPFVKKHNERLAKKAQQES